MNRCPRRAYCRPVVVPSAQMVWVPPTVAVLGAGVMFTVTSPVEGGHVPLVMVQRSTIGPAPLVCVKVANQDEALEKVPVPPLTTLHVPMLGVGLNWLVVPNGQMVCGPPTLAGAGGAYRVKVQTGHAAVGVPFALRGTTRQLYGVPAATAAT